MVDLSDAGPGVLGLVRDGMDSGTLVCLAYDVLSAAETVADNLDDRERIAGILAALGTLPGGPGLPPSLGREVLAEWRSGT